MSGAQFVPIGIPTICWSTMPSNCTYMFSMRKVKASHNSAQVQHLYESYFLLLKNNKKLIHQLNLQYAAAPRWRRGRGLDCGLDDPGSIPGLPIVETRILELAMSLLDFSPRIPLGTFSILPTLTACRKLWWQGGKRRLRTSRCPCRVGLAW